MWIERAIAPEDPLTQYNAACAYAHLGEAELAVDMLETWFSRVNKATRRWIITDNDFDLLRGLPRFADLVARLQ